MQKKLISLISLIMALLMILGVLASCSDMPTEGDATTEGITTIGKNETDAPGEDDNSNDTTSVTTTPDGTTPEGTTPEGTTPEGTTPEGTTPEGTTPEGTTPEGTTPEGTTPEGTTPESTKPEETKPEDDNDYNSLEVQNNALIQMSNGLANGVQAYFTDGNRTHYSFQNKEMTLTYARSNKYPQLVSSIKNTKGVSYIQNTMDVFVRMNSGNTYYASGSTTSAEGNLYRFGYYYYEGLFEFQNFTSESYSLGDPINIDLNKQFSNANLMSRSFSKNEVGNTLITLKITDSSDPYFYYKKNFNYSTADATALVIVAKALGNTTGVQFWVDLGNGFKQELSKTVKFINDGEFHTYYIPLDDIPGYKDATTLKGIRFDPNGSVDSGVVVESITIGKAIDVPTNLSINRHFHVYSDKMHHAIQFAVTDRTEDIAEIGMLTEIPVSAVSKLIVVTNDNKTYNSLDAGFSWDDVVAVGFDITDAGIFGFILPLDDAAGKIKVTVDAANGNYVIEQSRTPTLADGTAGVIIPSIDTEKLDENGNYIHATGVTNNANDVYLAQRVYTDESHSFAEFLKETGYEREPLADKRISISDSNSDNASYAGYDPIRGIYVLKIGTPVGGFFVPFNDPQKNYKVNFSLRSDTDRDIYIMTSGSGGLLECATLMDKDMMLLPVPIEVIKNFSEATGERNLFNIGDPTFSEAIFCLSLKKDVKYTYTIINLYQNWGNFPLKQLSSIPFHCPYYHLSTGVTETNCILPWLGMVNVGKNNTSTLPDFRSMSAPYWKGQPQHNSSGQHTWIKYTDSEGGTYIAECKENIITSYGPTYAEVVWHNITDDGKIKVTYTHMEMPQTDENRTYYTMEYEFLEDLTINNFKDNFQFYEVTDNNGTGTYKKLGYLNEQNECVVVDSNQDPDAVPEYVLGDNCPYFSFFMMPDWNRESGSSEGYANVAFLVHSSSFIIGGESKDFNFLIKNRKDHVAITLNEEGTIEFKAGDKITINAILLPWGSQQYEDNPSDRLSDPNAINYTDYTYSTVLPDGKLYMDKNVRDVRENTLLKPLKATSTTDEIIESPFLPKIKSKDGKSATFTISGGENNVAIRVYGFDMLTNPKVERQLEDGTWEEYVISSKNNPVNGYYHYYDGYMVNYDEDGTYSYSFVTAMEGGAPQTFRVTVSEKFKGWPSEPVPEERPNLLNIYTDPEELFAAIKAANHQFGTPSAEVDEIHGGFTRVYANTSAPEGFCTLHMDEDYTKDGGKYLVIKYRVPTTNSTSVGSFQLWASTTTKNAGEANAFSYAPIADGEWHVVIFDLTKAGLTTYTANDNSEYITKLYRFDIFNKEFTDPNVYIDIAYTGIDSDLSKICNLEDGKLEIVDYYEGAKRYDLDVATAQIVVDAKNDTLNYYTDAHELLTSINGSNQPFGSSSVISDATHGKFTRVFANTTGNEAYCYLHSDENYTKNAGKYLAIKYRVPTTNSEAIGEFEIWASTTTTAAGDAKSFRFTPVADGEWHVVIIDLTKTKLATYLPDGNGLFAPKLIRFDIFNKAFTDLNCYIDIAYVGIDSDISKICALEIGKLKMAELIEGEEKTELDVNTGKGFTVSYIDPSSGYTESDLKYASILDFINDSTANISSTSLKEGLYIKSGVLPNNLKAIKLNGWCCVEGGVEKYVYSIDGGKTWLECTYVAVDADDYMLEVAGKNAGGEGYTFSDTEATRKNAKFQSSGNRQVLIDLSNVEGTVDVILAAVPALDTSTLVLLFCFEDVDCSLKSAFDESSAYTEIFLPFGSQIDSINDVAGTKMAGSGMAQAPLTNVSTFKYNADGVNSDYVVKIKGWSAVDGGVSKYVWTADGGKTWNDCGGHWYTSETSSEAIVSSAQTKSHIPFSDTTASAKNAAFQGKGLLIDLSAYANSSEPVDIYVCAVPDGMTDRVVILYHITNVTFTPVE